MIAGVVLGMGFVTETVFANDEGNFEVSDACTVKDNRPDEWEAFIFPDDEVIEVRIYMDESQFEYMSENAINEVSVPASVVYNGIVIENIAIRPKGNSSLMNAVQEGQDGYSLHLEFDEYVDQDVYGITDINLNNCYGDDTYIRETLAYEIMEEMGLPVPETVFCDVYINDELFGVYLAVQQVDETLLAGWFENGTGDLYKPEGIGADLAYIDDDYDSYTGMIEKTNVDNMGEQELVNMLDVLNNGGDIEEVLNVDMILRYLAVDTAIINLDSYVGGMFHNYFLYGEDGQYMMIPWDLNETFMPFGGSGQDTIDVTQLLIDEPTSGAVENYPLVDALLSNSEYLERYRGYLEQIIEGPMQIDTFTERVEELYALIDEHIEADPNASYEAFLNALYDTDEETADAQMDKEGMMGNDSPALIDFVAARTENIAAQLSGEIASTNDGQGNNTGNIPSIIGTEEGMLDAVAKMGGRNEKLDIMTEKDMGIMREDMETGVPPEAMLDGEMPGAEIQPGVQMKGNIQSMPEGFGAWLLLEDNVHYLYMLGAALVLIVLSLGVKRWRKL